MNVKTWLIIRTYLAYLAAMEAVAWQKGAHTWQAFALVAAVALVGPALTALDPWDKSYGLVWQTVIMRLLRIAGMSAMGQFITPPSLQAMAQAPAKTVDYDSGGTALLQAPPVPAAPVTAPVPVPAPPVDVPQVAAPQPPAQL